MVERVDRTAQSELVAAAVLTAAAGGKVDLPDPDDRRDAFDRALNEKPRDWDTDQVTVMKALGVGPYGDAR